MNFYWCNTNRREGRENFGDESYFEHLMRKHSTALAWGQFDSQTRMAQVEAGDIILFFAQGSGIVGIGKARAGLQVVPPHRPQYFTRRRELERLNPEWRIKEWRIPVKWIAWDAQNPLSFSDFKRTKGVPLQRTFILLRPSKWSAAIGRAFEHFGLSHTGKPKEERKIESEETRLLWRRSQGYEPNPIKRRTIERHALEVAKRHYCKAFSSVVEKGKPYDLKCKSNALEAHVEVKGTTGSVGKVILTRNEVAHAGKGPYRSDIFIVPRIRLSSDGRKAIASGKPVIKENWVPAKKHLKATHYEYAFADDFGLLAEEE